MATSRESCEYFYIVSQLNGLVLDISGKIQGASLITYPYKVGENCDSQLWRLDGNFLRSKTGLVADVYGSNRPNGTKVIAFAQHGGENQQWEISDGRIRSKLNNLVMDISEHRCINNSPGASVIMWSEKSRSNSSQLWKMIPEKEIDSCTAGDIQYQHQPNTDDLRELQRRMADCEIQLRAKDAEIANLKEADAGKTIQIQKLERKVDELERHGLLNLPN